MPNVQVGRYSKVRRAILDTGVNLPRNSTVGYDREADLAKGYLISEGGVTVVPATP
jgi:glucose-1-phosphate adenylyltransferase